MHLKERNLSSGNYDSLFIHARAQESPQQAAVLALGRLRYPLELSQEASVMYREYLVQHPVEAAACLLKNDSMDDWRWFVGEFTPCGEKMIKVEHAAAGCLGNEGYAVRAREEYSDIKKPVLGKTGFAKLIEASNQAECIGSHKLSDGCVLPGLSSGEEKV